MLNPGGSLSLAVGSLSGAAAIGGGTIGASFAAASLPAGRPMRGEPGGSGAAAAGAAEGAGLAAGGGLVADGEAAGCCAAAPNGNGPKKAPAPNTRRRAGERPLMTFSPAGALFLPPAPFLLAPGGFPGRR